MKPFIAHKRKDDGVEQTVKAHLLETAKGAATFASAFHNQEYAFICGLLHDSGKYSVEFQHRIRENGKRCDHSSAGARIWLTLVEQALQEVSESGAMNPQLLDLLSKQKRHFARLGAYCITGHHSGLLDYGARSDSGGEGTLCGRLAITYKIPDYSAYAEELSEYIEQIQNVKLNLKPLNKGGFSIAFMTRMLYSALVDADFLDTEKFMKRGEIQRGGSYNFRNFRQQLDKKFADLKGDGLLNDKRNEIREACEVAAKGQRGLYTLEVPTGGGKTLASMSFALNHLLENGMERIIYVIPYTAIIEQNAMVFKGIFGEENVLEHHCQFDFGPEQTDEDAFNQQKLSAENWDAPIIVTTNVQFFESLFANKSSKCRKLHNIANSVIIFDEVQVLPEDYLIPCVMSIAELIHNCHATAVLCSATQPAIAELFPKQIENHDICSGIKGLQEIFRRTKVIEAGVLESAELAEKLDKLEQCLCIVNTRKHALKVYSNLRENEKYHLSTLMCPKHRKDKVEEIKKRLYDGERCRVVSTKLIEAGVDVDFPYVYRSMAGLDSIIQAAGRCNREGAHKDSNGNLCPGEVNVFTPETEFVKHQPSQFKMEAEVARQIMDSGVYDEIISTASVEDYFKRLHNYKGEEGLDSYQIYSHFESAVKNFTFDFKYIADKFQLIEDNTIPILIPYDEEAEKLIRRLESAEYFGGILRKLQPYTVGIYNREYENLLGAGKLRQVKEGIFTLIDREDCNYSMETGLNIEVETGIAAYL